MSQSPPLPARPQPVREFHSWKEVAVYLGISVRRAQQWEKDFGLPISRVLLNSRGRIFATSVQLDNWRRERLAQAPDAATPLPGDVPAPGSSGAAAHGPAPGVSRRRPLVWAVPVTALLVILALAGLGWMRWGQRPQPSAATIVDGRLVVSDQQGRTLWTVAFPEGGAQPAPEMANVPENQGVKTSHSHIIADIDGDRSREILFALNVTVPMGPPRPDRVICYDADGTERWRFQPGRALTWQGRAFDENYDIHWMAAPLVVNGRRTVAVGSQNRFFPFQVALLDSATGALLGEYWHPGGLSSVLPMDLDRDGRLEIVAAGVNNPGPGAGLPALAVLKMPLPTLGPGDDVFARSARAASRYLLFPPVDGLQAYPSVRAAKWLERDAAGAIRLGVSYGADFPERGTVHYMLDRQLHVVDARPCDLLRNHLLQLTREGRRRQPLTDEEIRSWRDVRQFDTMPNANLPEIQALWSKEPRPAATPTGGHASRD